MPHVIIDRGRHTGIVVSVGRKLIQAILLEEGELRLRAYHQSDLAARGFQDLDYPPKKAARAYLKHGGGVSPKAAKALRRV